MNVLTLRINPGEKRKNTMSFAPVTFEMHNILGFNNDLFKVFLSAVTVDEQLHTIKNIINKYKTNCDSDVIKFLALVFLQAEVKHPVKCFVIRHVTRSDYLQPEFSEKLAVYIDLYTNENHEDYHSYARIVSKIGTCIESFPAGVMAIKLVEVKLAAYLINCLKCSITTLSNVKTLAPTEKNKIFSLGHLTLRLLLCIIQKANDENVSKFTSMFEELRLYIKYLLFNEDTPMDTKTLSGIVSLTLLCFENGKDSWTMILDENKADKYIATLLQNDSAELSLHSAIITVVPFEKLQTLQLCDKPALICLTKRIMAIGERTSSESVFSLSVTRSIVQLSKQLHRVKDRELMTWLMDQVLEFCWAHIDHYMDSVRHLAAQALATVVKCAASFDNDGLERVVQALNSRDRDKGWCVGLGALCVAAGARRLLAALPDCVTQLTQLARDHPNASTALEIILEVDARESDTETLFETWVKPALWQAQSTSDPTVLSTLQNLMAKAVILDKDIINYIVPEIKSLLQSSPHNIKSVLMLLHVSRKAGGNKWGELLPPHLLDMAAVHADHDIRILSLALVAESPKSTEPFNELELSFVLRFLKYNINAQAPNFRQQMLSLFNKLLKRLGDSYRVLRRQNEPNTKSDNIDYYLSFVERLRGDCFISLIPGANYTRRTVALQLLVYCQNLNMEGYHWEWCAEYVCRLVERLEDTYDDNRSRARSLLLSCPHQLLQSTKFHVSIELSNILRQASSLKPTDCVSAAYKLLLLKDKLPEVIIEANQGDRAQNEPVSYALLNILLARLKAELAECELSIVRAPRHGPLYGTLHCIRRILQDIDSKAISSDKQWGQIVREIIEAGDRASGVAGVVVNNSSPEGHLPMDQGVILTDHGNSGGIRLEDGRAVTAQMLLLCAWRTVKEVSLLLGNVVARLSIQGEGQPDGILSQHQVLQIGEHFSKLLAETKHRGAFEQAYVGFTEFLSRVWQCCSPTLHSWGRDRLSDLLGQLQDQHQNQTHPTRRSAGLPFMIQALVITELQVKGNPTCLHECMTTLLKLARASTEPNHIKQASLTQYGCGGKPDENNQTDRCCKDIENNSDESTQSQMDVASVYIQSSVETRAHCMNILRALFRNSALEESVAGYVGDGLMVALEGFNKDTWMERNAATLLFSALVTRVFGPARHRDRMTGRIFFLRYPMLYDYIVQRLEAVGPTIEVELNPGLFPVLVLLSKLYPSSLEGIESSLSLTTLSPHRSAAARSPSLYARIAASTAYVAPLRYIPHLESLLSTLSSLTLKRNHCHGALLQINKLLAERPDSLVVADEDRRRISRGIYNSIWILEQASSSKPCYLIADEYVKMINLIVWRLPSIIDHDMLKIIKDHLGKILFTDSVPLITIGREICLANITYLYIIILGKRCHSQQHNIEQNIKSISLEETTKSTDPPCQLYECTHHKDITTFIYKSLSHKSYEVVLTCLNYLLILHKKLEIENHFQEHLSTIMVNENVKNILKRNETFAEELCDVMKRSKYIECILKSLSLLSLEDDTQKYIVELKIRRKPTSDDEIVNTLLDCIKNENDNFTHIYLESLRRFVTRSFQIHSLKCSLSEEVILDVVRTIFDCCTSENGDITRKVAAAFLQGIFSVLIELNIESLSEGQKFELSATLYAALVTLLEDDDADIRTAASEAASVLGERERGAGRVVASRAGEIVRDAVREPAILVMLALLDFRCEVYLTDELNDECRVFDQNERYNIFLEETVWTRECADKLVTICQDNVDVITYVRSIVDNPIYSRTIHKLCNNNVVIFKKMLDNSSSFICRNDVTNPKIKLFVSKLLCKESI